VPARSGSFGWHDPILFHHHHQFILDSDLGISLLYIPNEDSTWWKQSEFRPVKISGQSDLVWLQNTRFLNNSANIDHDASQHSVLDWYCSKQFSCKPPESGYQRGNDVRYVWLFKLSETRVHPRVDAAVSSDGRALNWQPPGVSLVDQIVNAWIWIVEFKLDETWFSAISWTCGTILPQKFYMKVTSRSFGRCNCQSKQIKDGRGKRDQKAENGNKSSGQIRWPFYASKLSLEIWMVKLYNVHVTLIPISH